MATAILLSVFLRAQHFPAAPLFSRSCQNNRVTEKTSSLSSAQKHFPVGGTMGRAGNKGAPRSDERRVSPRCVFGSGIFFFYFSTDEALRPGDVLTPWGGAGFLSAPVGRGAADGNCVFLFFVWTERHQEGRVVRGRCRFFPRAEGRFCQDARCQNTHQSARRSPRRFNTPTAEKLNSTKAEAALRLSGSVGTHIIIVCSIIFLGRPHLHSAEWTPETGAQLRPREQRWRLFNRRGGSQINTFLALKVTSGGWQWEGSQGAISYLFVLWSDLSLDKVSVRLITVSVLRSNRGPLRMFSGLEVPDVGAKVRKFHG